MTADRIDAAEISRRRFLERTLLAAAAAPLAGCAGASGLGDPAPAESPATKDADPIRVAVIGVRGRGRAHVGAFQRSPDAEVVALCDCDLGVVDGALQVAPNARVVRDVRELLDDPGIDAVSIATPNHWHALGTVWALQAGKHVYVEKPISHDLAEGRAVVAAARRSGLVLQHGTQARSHAATRQAMEWLHAGGLGELSRAKALCYKRRESIGRVDGPREPPPTCDYDLWTGPARMQPLRRANLHYDWHWVWNTGNGDIGNQGVHQMDIARWGLGLSGFPRGVWSCGGRYGYVDDANTPNTQIATFDYGEGAPEFEFEVRGLPTEPYHGAHIGVVFHGERGTLVSASYARVVAYDTAGAELAVFEGGGDHVQQFLDAVRAGDPSAVTAPADEAHVSAGLCHLANASLRLGTPGPLTGELSAPERVLRTHLDDVGIPADAPALRGAALRLDPSTGDVLGELADASRAFLARELRAPFTFGARA